MIESVMGKYMCVRKRTMVLKLTSIEEMGFYSLDLERFIEPVQSKNYKKRLWGSKTNLEAVDFAQ